MDGRHRRSRHPLDDTSHWAYVNPLSRATLAVFDISTAFEALDDQSVLQKMSVDPSSGNPMTEVTHRNTADRPSMSPMQATSAQRELPLAEYAVLNFSKRIPLDTPFAMGKGETIPDMVGYSAPPMIDMPPKMSSSTLQLSSVAGTNPMMPMTPDATMIACCKHLLSSADGALQIPRHNHVPPGRQLIVAMGHGIRDPLRCSNR